LIIALYQKAIQAAKMADNYEMADPNLSRVEALQMAFKVQRDMEE